jgi:hypothetical protein
MDQTHLGALEAIKVKPKSGKERFAVGSRLLNVRLEDFWRWSVSDLVSNATRGRLAEFIVAMALEIDLKSSVRSEWDAYDLETSDGVKIEVKSCAYIQSWRQTRHSTISFSIRPSRHWDSSTNVFSDTIKRQADLYVFCLLKHMDEDIDPMRLEQWEFYVVPTEKLNTYPRSQSSITLRSLQTLTDPVNYGQLREMILNPARS